MTGGRIGGKDICGLAGLVVMDVDGKSVDGDEDEGEQGELENVQVATKDRSNRDED